MVPAHPIADRLQPVRHLVRFVRLVLARFQHDDGMRLCASLAYTTLLAIVPVVAVGLGVFAAFPVFDNFTAAIQDFFAQNLLPRAVADRVLAYIDQFARNAGKLTAIGLAFVAVTAFMLMGTIETAFNGIWRSRHARPIGVRVLVYWAVMTLGPLVIGASLTMTSIAFQRWVAPAVQWTWALKFIVWAIPFAMTTVGFTLLYLVVPVERVAPRHAIAGGLVAAVIFELMKSGFAAYLGHGSNYASVYGTLAAIPIFLAWIYASWVVVVIGAQIVALAPDYHHASRRLVAPSQPGLHEIYAVLAVLVRALAAGKPAAQSLIAHETALPREMVVNALALLERGGFVGSVGGAGSGRWTLVCDPDRVTLAEVRAKVDRRPRNAPADAITQALDAAETAAAAALDRPLRSLVETPADG